MKKVYTRLFRIGGVWQLGFPGLSRNEAEQLKDLRGFRYNETLRLWHISFHADTVNYINRKYDGSFYFVEDPEKEDAPDLPVEEKPLSSRILIDTLGNKIQLSHTYHTSLFRELGSLEGAYFDKTKRYWIIPYKENYKLVKELLAQYKFAFQPELLQTNKRITFKPDQIQSDKTIAYKSKENISQEHSVDDNSIPAGIKNPGKALSSDEISLVEKFEKELYLRNRSKRTIESYHSAIVRFMKAFSSRNLQEVPFEEIRDYLHRMGKERGYSYSTLNIQVSAIKTFYRYLFQVELRQVDIPRPRKKKVLPKVISKEEVELMIRSTRNMKHRAILATLYSTAMRREELLNLKLQDLDLDHREVRIHGKGGKDRYVYLSESYVNQMERYLDSYRPREYVFEGPGGSRYSGSSVGRILEDAGRRARLSRKVTPHMLRHSYATHMLSAGVSLVHIQKILGHSNIKTTLIYTHITDRDLRNLPNPLDGMDL